LSACNASAVNGRRALLVGTAVSFASVDLVHKSLVAADYHHTRTPLVAVAMGAVIGALVLLVPRISSNAAAIGAGIACGGAFGNLVSLFAWPQGVPDPLVIGRTTGIAFNLADLFAITGDMLLLSAVAVHGMRNRHQLRERV
jgi:lipoprotein signal peptidase